MIKDLDMFLMEERKEIELFIFNTIACEEPERTDEYPYGDTIEPHDVAVEEELLFNLD